ncbi:DegT/DnrJ/EryC1/StrS family aminotransferase [Flavobacteriaceae bacterium]|jgi:dTDP-4-amino-4,6-dideoxygalactose transaminase|nr:DegT/DnrJ/EryC1/StrS family aminotransferase [Flavobacteriaceae bacterium]
MITVTKPFLPPKKDYFKYIDGIWERNHLTNMGPLANKLEMKLKEYLNINHLLFVTNGTIALQIAIKALRLKGEIITTPFTYVATSSSIVWEGCTPVYVDIDKNSLNIDSSKIEAAITKKTTAIVATHVFGNPCDVETIKNIADRHNLKVIYDGAHAFGVKLKGKSIFEYGDISTCSTHATKLFHSSEGGFVVTKDLDLLKTMTYMRNFGHNGEEKFHGLGINGKNSEFHAAMGLANLKFINSIHEQRKKLTKYYDIRLKNAKVIQPLWNKSSSRNYAYYPIIFETEALLLKCIRELKLNDIFARRYFYPSLGTSLPYVETALLSHADNISKRILCLPLFYDLTVDQVDLICTHLLKSQNS